MYVFPGQSKWQLTILQMRVCALYACWYARWCSLTLFWVFMRLCVARGCMLAFCSSGIVRLRGKSMPACGHCGIQLAAVLGVANCWCSGIAAYPILNEWSWDAVGGMVVGGEKTEVEVVWLLEASSDPSWSCRFVTSGLPGFTKPGFTVLECQARTLNHARARFTCCSTSVQQPS